MNIAIIGSRNFPAQHGGLEIVVENLAHEYAQQGHTVHVFVSNKPQVSNEEIPEGIQVHYGAAFRTKHLHTLSQILLSIPKVRSLAPDIVHIHGVGPSIPLILGRQIFGAPTVVTCHGIDWERAKWNRVAASIFKSLASTALGRAAALTAVSKTTALRLSDITSRHVVEISNGVDTMNYLPIEWGEREAGVVLAARLTPEKQVHCVTDVYTQKIADRFGPLLILGDGGSSYSSPYESFIHRTAAAGVKFLGRQSRQSTLKTVRERTTFISCSALEAQPIAVLEALALETPLLLSDIPEHREIAGDAALYFDPTTLDDTTLAELLQDIRDNESELRTRMAKRRTEFTWRIKALEYLHLFTSIKSNNER